MLKFAILVLYFSVTTLLSSPKAKAQVWSDTNTWSADYENLYASWVQENWSVDFFSRKVLSNGQANPYYGLRVDCADAVYSMRLIFAFENNLPFVIQDPTTTKRVITNQMSRWNHLTDSHQRVRNFLVYIFNVVSTASLPNDSFPVPLDRQWIRSGAFIRTTKINHHSWTIKDMQLIGIPHLVFNSTVGRTSGFGMQERVSWPNPQWIFEGDFTPASNAGFRAWRPQEYLNRPVWETPHYSEEQFKIPLDKWQRHIQKKLALSHESEEQGLQRLRHTACESLKNRLSAVEDGVKYLRSMTTECMDFATYDTYSTPNRDERLFDDVAALRRAYRDILKTDDGNSLSSDMKKQMNKIFPYIQHSAAGETARMSFSNITEDSICSITYAAGKTIDFAEAKRRLFANLFSNNPMDDIQYRWGRVQGPSPRAKACLSWEIWQPDLKKAD